MILEKYSIGVGDRFGRQGKAQLRALAMAVADGLAVVPVWNKSRREHSIIGTRPEDVRREAEEAVRAMNWTAPFHVDADHISMSNVEAFLAASDFFTVDVAEHMGRPSAAADVDAFVSRCLRYVPTFQVPGIGRPFRVSRQELATMANKFLAAVQEASRIHERIRHAKGTGNYIVEVSFDESDYPQTPVELFFILEALADAHIPLQTIAPKFTGRFNKGVDYEGDRTQFAREFDDDLAVVAQAVKEFDLPANLKLSVHSGSDKFSIYGDMRKAIRRHGAGLHLKTAGTTWLEELTGLALGGGAGLQVAREIYRAALGRIDELCAPYAAVIHIDRSRLPTPAAVDGWSGQEYAQALRHDSTCDRYNPHLRQLLHVGYKMAAEMGRRYLGALEEFEEIIGDNVTANLYERHLRPVFLMELDGNQRS